MKKYYKAFTLIEILVTIGIIALLLAAAVPSFNKYGRSNEFYQVAQTLKSAIETTQNYALAPRVEKKEGVDIYGILITGSGSDVGFQYQIYEGDTNTIIETKNFSNDILTITKPIGTKIDIKFSISEKGKIISPDNISDIIMQLTNPDSTASGNKLNIDIKTLTGDVEINEAK